MSRSAFGGSYPPGAANHPLAPYNAPDPQISDLVENVLGLLEDAGIDEATNDQVVKLIEAAEIRKARAENAAEHADIAAIEGQWRWNGRLTLMPSYYDQPDRVFGALLLTADAAVTEAEVAGWTSEQRKLAAEWALSVHASASDNEDVIVPERPAFIAKAEGR